MIRVLLSFYPQYLIAIHCFETYFLEVLEVSIYDLKL